MANALAVRTQTFPWMRTADSAPLARRGSSPALASAKKRVEELEAATRKLRATARQNLGSGMGMLLTAGEIAAGGAASGAIDGAIARWELPQWMSTTGRAVVGGGVLAVGAFLVNPKTGRHICAFGAGILADVVGDTVRNLVMGKE